LLTEARVVLPGAQALFGFQLAIVLTRAFEQLPKASIIVHAASLFLVAIASHDADGSRPLSQDRLCRRGYRRYVPGQQHARDGGDRAARFGTGGEVFVVIAKISGSFAIGSFTGGVAFVFLIGLWYLYPIIVARRGK
jgi:hypothetical protein